MMLTQKRLKELLHYCQYTGIFRWRVSVGSIKVGDIAGSLEKGYVRICIDGKRYRAHRLAFLYMLGYIPKDQVDHINGIKNNNVWTNLREADQTQNSMNGPPRKNNKSGYRGVYWCPKAGKWRAQIKVNGKRLSLGFYHTPEEAGIYYQQAAEKYFGEYAYQP